MLDCTVCGQDLTPTFDKVKDHFPFFSSSESVLVSSCLDCLKLCVCVYIYISFTKNKIIDLRDGLA